MNLKYQSKLTRVRKFYFLDYFYVLLKSIEEYENGNLFNKNELIFTRFKKLKDALLLGESKYKKIGAARDIYEKKDTRYRYTYNQVVEEAELYNLITTYPFRLKDKGKLLLKKFDREGILSANLKLFSLMETQLNGFRTLLQLCYEANTRNSGLLIFPIYSPLKLGMERSKMKLTSHIIQYCDLLVRKIESDIDNFLGKTVSLKTANQELLNRLKDAGLISFSDDASFNPKKYNVITKRIRDYWLNHFLKDIYKIDISLSYFEIWSYRGKQFGIINSTEFFPNFNGRIVYPVAIIDKNIHNNDFTKIFYYKKTFEWLFVHEPTWDSFHETFVQSLYESYYDLKKTNNIYFINLADLGDVVCYKLKISTKTFTEFLNKAYSLNLAGELRIKISLEADKLPYETQATYLKREPIFVQGKLKNIIAIEIK